MWSLMNTISQKFPINCHYAQKPTIIFGGFFFIFFQKSLDKSNLIWYTIFVSKGQMNTDVGGSKNGKKQNMVQKIHRIYVF